MKTLALEALPTAPERGFGQPPVGLAGLLSWWREQTDQATMPQALVSGDGNLRTPAAYGAHGFEPWETPATPSADQIRDALEQLLLDEVVADGLEVTNGSR